MQTINAILLKGGHIRLDRADTGRFIATAYFADGEFNAEGWSDEGAEAALHELDKEAGVE